jgi:DNA adenine methylase
MKPLLKWVGGKTQILSDVFDKFPKEFKNYYEPFIGGGSVLIELLQKIERNELTCHGRIYASDLNPRLISFYKHVQTNPKELWIHVEKFKQDIERCKNPTDPEYRINRNPSSLEEAFTSKESLYFWHRKQYNNMDVESVTAAALFLTLNKTCFRGIYREGPRGFNVPYGNYKNTNICDESTIMEMSKLFCDVEFRCRSFEDALNEVDDGDFVYMDPPYVPENDTSFVQYTKHGFDIKKHEELFGIIRSMTDKKVKVLMSNSDVKLVRDSFVNAAYSIDTLCCKRAINSKKPQSTTNEVLIKNF